MGKHRIQTNKNTVNIDNLALSWFLALYLTPSSDALVHLEIDKVR